MVARRELILSGLAAGLSVTGIYSIPAMAQTAVQRENIESFSTDPKKVAALRLAFQKLQARSLDATVGWYNFAAIHGVRSGDPQGGALPPSLKSYWNQCHRDEALFFIWHRAYLAALESNLQKLSGESTLRLPYWDWYTQPSLPAIFRPEYLDAAKTEKNPLYRARRNGLDQGMPVWTPYNSGAVDQAGFAEFQQTLNGNEHGDIHGFIGGDMRSISTAARDPIFWFHHCNIDRLIAAWINRPNMIVDQTTAFDAGKYKFPIEGASDYTPLGASLDMASSAPLGTAYESLDGPFKEAGPSGQIQRPKASRVIPSKTGALNKSVLALNAPTSVAVPAGGLNIAFNLPVKNDTKLKSVFQSAPIQAATSVTLRFDNVAIDDVPEGVSAFDVFVDLPTGGTDNPGPLKVGTISLFSLTMPHDGMTEPMPRSFAFNAASQFQQQINKKSLTVSLVPRIAPGVQVSSSAAGIKIGNASVELSNVPIE